MSDVMIAMSVRDEADRKIQKGWPIWMYLTDYYNPSSFPENFPVKGRLSLKCQLFCTVFLFKLLWHTIKLCALLNFA